MALQLFQSSLPPCLHFTSSSNSSLFSLQTPSVHNYAKLPWWGFSVPLHRSCPKMSCRRRRSIAGLVFVGKEETQLRVSSPGSNQDDDDPSPQDLEYVSQIKRVLDLLRKNRDMLFSEVKLTILIEDPREVERRRLLGIDDSEAPTRDDLADALEEVKEGKVPKNRVALRMLAEEMIQWPNLEV
ncbi:hypothetical protein U1Q18_010258 [Sarracenia purpurea var. burkii]